MVQGDGGGDLDDREYHKTTLELLAAQLKQAMQVLVSQHENAIHLVSDCYSLCATTTDALVRNEGANDGVSSSRLLKNSDSYDLPGSVELTLAAVGVDSNPDDGLGSFGSGFQYQQAIVRPQYKLLDCWVKKGSSRAAQGRKTTEEDVKTLKSHHHQSVITQDVEPKNAQRTYVADGCSSKIVVHPHDSRRSMWDIGSLVLVLYDMVMIPMGFFDPPDSPFTVFMAWTTRLFWTADMPLTCVSGFVDIDGAIELRHSKIMKRYMKTWFLLDMVVVGVDWLEIIMAAAAEGLGFARLGKASRIFRILRLIRLLRLARMTEIIQQLTERLNSEKLVIVLDLTKLLVIMIGAGHLVACLWYGIAAGENSERNWLDVHEFKNEPLELRYLMSFRWAMSQFAGGMDEVTPHSLAEHIYALFMFFVAFWSGAVFLSILTSSMTQWYIVGSQQAQQLLILRRYLHENGISKVLALRVQRNATNSLAEQQKIMPEESVELLKQVSEPLRVELHFEMYSPTLCIHPFFGRYVEECPHVVRKICHSAMASENISKMDTIFNVGEIPADPRMFIVTRGLLRYMTFDGDTELVSDKSWISEHPLWVEWTHKGTLIAAVDTLIYILRARQFHEIINQFEHMDFDPYDYATSFLDNLNHVEHTTDLHTEFDHSEVLGKTDRGSGLSENLLGKTFNNAMQLFTAGNGPQRSHPTRISRSENSSSDERNNINSTLILVSPNADTL